MKLKVTLFLCNLVSTRKQTNQVVNPYSHTLDRCLFSLL
nr:MAG TPA: hypothetical protein [Caudoviricetes sp.]